MSNVKGIRVLILNANQISEVFDVFGVQFKLYSATDVDGLLIKINSGDWEAIIATHTAIPKNGIKTVQFKNVSGSSNTARWAVWPYRIADNLTEVASEALDSLLEQTQGDTTPENFDTEKTIGVAQSIVLAANTDRKACSVQAKSTNTGIIYIGFDNTVSTTKWIAELQPGMSWSVDDYRGAIYAVSDTAAQKLGWGEW